MFVRRPGWTAQPGAGRTSRQLGASLPYPLVPRPNRRFRLGLPVVCSTGRVFLLREGGPLVFFLKQFDWDVWERALCDVVSLLKGFPCYLNKWNQKEMEEEQA